MTMRKNIKFKLQATLWQVWLSLANSSVGVVCRYSLRVQLHPYAFLVFNISILTHFHLCAFLLLRISILANFYSQLGQRDCVCQLPIQIASCNFPFLSISIRMHFCYSTFPYLLISTLSLVKETISALASYSNCIMHLSILEYFHPYAFPFVCISVISISTMRIPYQKCVCVPNISGK